MSCVRNRTENPQVVSRADARALGLKRYFTGVPCKNGHSCERLTSTAACLDCILLFNQRLRAKDPEKYRLYSLNGGRRHRAAHPDTDQKYYAKAKDRILAKTKEWHSKNAEKVREIKAEYKARNRPKLCEYQNRRRAQQLNATPKWLSREQIAEMANIYVRANELGRGWQVDHIVPLKGELVCGLHVPWNLQVIPARENASKGNRLVEVLS